MEPRKTGWLQWLKHIIQRDAEHASNIPRKIRAFNMEQSFVARDDGISFERLLRLMERTVK